MTPTKLTSFIISKNLANLRADRAAADLLPHLSRSKAKILIEAHGFYHNQHFSKDPGARLKEKDEVSFPEILAKPQEPPKTIARDIPLNLLYEDNDLIILDKSAGLVVHPAPGHLDDTLVNALMAHCPDVFSTEQNDTVEKLETHENHPENYGGEDRPGIVHRLDKETSGVMVVAKSPLAFKELSRAFAERDLSRRYVALVWGNPPDTGEWEGNIGRSRNDRKKMAVLKDSGKPAKTYFKVLERFGKNGENLALVECKLATGRTHQIRVHFSHHGFPLVGDPVYLKNIPRFAKTLPPASRNYLLDFPRQALHAAHLGFKHPKTGEWVEFSTELPPDFKEILEHLREAEKNQGKA
ncbi:ribosomal large subunit pseudouridine synthase d [Lasius niger]|uniref:Pseudouridine synthase n=1 Tax=Lasius niger TaxID=67767 RepID=A0A0J7KEH9_LASNI|nr:ribosomal large subunit pseudouridine synthase d [Lasius niger]